MPRLGQTFKGDLGIFEIPETYGTSVRANISNLVGTRIFYVFSNSTVLYLQSTIALYWNRDNKLIPAKDILSETRTLIYFFIPSISTKANDVGTLIILPSATIIFSTPVISRPISFASCGVICKSPVKPVSNNTAGI